MTAATTRVTPSTSASDAGAPTANGATRATAAPVPFAAISCIPVGSSFERAVDIDRPRSVTEWAAGAALLRDYFDWLTVQFRIGVTDAQPRATAELESLAAVFDRPGAAFFLARQRRLPVGTVGLLPAGEPGTVELCRFYARPAARGLGVGRRLLERALDEARSLGYSTVVLDTCPDSMAAAVRLYETQGFVRTAERPSVPVAHAVRYRLELTP